MLGLMSVIPARLNMFINGTQDSGFSYNSGIVAELGRRFASSYCQNTGSGRLFGDYLLDTRLAFC